jgi:hypothetical protein
MEQTSMRQTLILLAAVAAGCAAPPTQPPKAIQQIDTAAPRCTAGVQCERQWLAAQDTLQTITGMRLRIVTDTRLETFAPTGYGRLGGQVVKYPLDAATFELRVRLECYGGVDCEDLRNTGTNLFNRTVTAAK